LDKRTAQRRIESEGTGKKVLPDTFTKEHARP